MLVTSTGGTIAHEIPVAVATPGPTSRFFGLMALLGLYVGVIPIAIGMLWLPWIRRIPPGGLRVVMAVTVGLLAFLAVDATLEGLELAGEGSQAFGGAALVLLGAVVAFLALSGVSAWLEVRSRARAGTAASRSWWRSASACTTSARDWSSGRRTPPARSRSAPSWSSASPCTTPRRAWPSWRRSRTSGRRRPASSCSGCWPARPPCAGAWLGAAAPNASVSAFLFGVGAGAIVQVIAQLVPSMRDGDGRALHPAAVGGVLGGMAVMFATGLLVAV